MHLLPRVIVATAAATIFTVSFFFFNLPTFPEVNPGWAGSPIENLCEWLLDISASHVVMLRCHFLKFDTITIRLLQKIAIIDTISIFLQTQQPSQLGHCATVPTVGAGGGGGSGRAGGLDGGHQM